MPDAAYLAAISAAGVDVQYILTGVRSGVAALAGAGEEGEEGEEEEKKAATAQPDLDADAGPPTRDELLDRERLRKTVAAVERLLRRKMTPEQKADLVVACYDVLGELQAKHKAHEFTQRLQAFLGSRE